MLAIIRIYSSLFWS